MNELIGNSAYLGVLISLASYALGMWLRRKTGLSFLNPLLISIVLVIIFLSLSGMSYETYAKGSYSISFLLTPATICLAISFYEQIDRLKKHLLPIMIGVLCGVLCSIGSIYLMSKAFGLSDAMMFSLLPKSVTTAIGVVLSEEMGGIAAITTAVIIITGISGNILMPPLCKWLRLEDPIAQGVATGTSSHVIGTTRAFEMSEMAGAVSSLSLTIAGLITSVLLSFLAPYL